MKPASPPFPRKRVASLLAGGLLAALSLAIAGGDEPAFEKQVNLVYTVNNFGYIDLCG